MAAGLESSDPQGPAAKRRRVETVDVSEVLAPALRGVIWNCRHQPSSDVDQVICTNIAGNEVARLQVPPGEDTFGQWLLDAVVEQRKNSEGLLRLIDPSGQLLWKQERALGGHTVISEELEEDKVYKLTFKIAGLGPAKHFGIGLVRSDIANLRHRKPRLLGWTGRGRAINKTGVLVGSRPSAGQIRWNRDLQIYCLIMDMPSRRLSMSDYKGKLLGTWDIEGLDGVNMCLGVCDGEDGEVQLDFQDACTELNLCYHDFELDCAEHGRLIKSALPRNLRVLSLSNIHVSEEAIEALDLGNTVPQLRVLKLNSLQTFMATETAGRTLGRGCPRGLAVLHLGGNMATNPKAIAAMDLRSATPQLQELYLCENNLFNGTEVGRLIGASLPSSLLALDLSHTHCSSDVLRAMDLRTSTPQLQDLNLSACGAILDLSFEDVAHSGHEVASKVSGSFPSSLKVLKLEDVRCQPASIAQLSLRTSAPALRTLALGTNDSLLQEVEASRRIGASLPASLVVLGVEDTDASVDSLVAMQLRVATPSLELLLASSNAALWGSTSDGQRMARSLPRHLKMLSMIRSEASAAMSAMMTSTTFT